jgi:hypothetical protein
LAKRKAVPTEGDSSGGVTETAPADSIYLGKSTKPEFIYQCACSQTNRKL